MKKYFLYTLLLGAMAMLGACTKSVPNPPLPTLEDVTTRTNNTFSLASPASGTSLTLLRANATAQVRITWNRPNATNVTYAWVAAELNDNFSTPYLRIPADSSGRAAQLTLTQQAIDDALAGKGVASGARVNLKWSVEATWGGQTRLALSPFNISITRMSEVTFTLYAPANTPADARVFLAGEFGFIAGMSNWQQPGTQPGLQMTRQANGTYQIKLPVPAGQAFNYKYFLVPGTAATWSHGERRPNASGTGSTGDGTDRRLVYDGATNEVFEWVPIWEGYEFDYVLFTISSLPANTPTDLNVFAAGGFNAFGASVAAGQWQEPGTNPRLQLMNMPNSSARFILFPRPANGTSLEYKFFLSRVGATRWSNGEQQRTAPNSCSGLPNRSYTFTGTNAVQDHTVQVWEGFCF